MESSENYGPIKLIQYYLLFLNNFNKILTLKDEKKLEKKTSGSFFPSKTGF